MTKKIEKSRSRSTFGLRQNQHSTLALVLVFIVGVMLGRLFDFGSGPSTNVETTTTTTKTTDAAVSVVQTKSEAIVAEEDEEARNAHVEELLSHVEAEYKFMCREMLLGKPVSFAQGWQDWMIYHNYFRDRKWGEGFYLDIGANEATFISNTLFFDKCLGWRGVCAEPQKQYHAAIKSKRGCELLPNCVLGKDTKVSSTLGGVDFTVKEVDANTEGAMECVGVETLKKKYGFEKIDLVSLDIEGMEWSVLNCWPYETVETTMFVVETNKQSVNMVDFFFHRHGYVNADTFTNVANGNAHFIDNLYVKDDRKPFPHPPLDSFKCTAVMKKYMGLWCEKFAMSMDNEKWFKKEC